MRLEGALDAYLELHATRRGTRVLALLFMAGYLAILWFVHAFFPPGIVVIALFALISYFSPDSEAPLITAGFGVVAWGMVSTREAVTSPWTLLAALCLLGFHSVCVLTSTGPGPAALERAHVLTWVRRNAVVAAVTTLAWGIMTGVRQLTLGAPAWAPGLMLAAFGLAGLLLARRSAGRPGED